MSFKYLIIEGCQKTVNQTKEYFLLITVCNLEFINYESPSHTLKRLYNAMKQDYNITYL